MMRVLDTDVEVVAQVLSLICNYVNTHYNKNTKIRCKKAKVCLLQPHYTNEIEVYRKLLIPATADQMMVVIHFLLKDIG